MQILLVMIILAGAVTYSCRRIYKTLSTHHGQCFGCPLADTCKRQKATKNKRQKSKSSLSCHITNKEAYSEPTLSSTSKKTDITR